MNVFLCDPDPRAAARALADRHVVKMPLEATQVFCTVGTELGVADPERWYRPTHRGHPCTRGVLEDTSYRAWVALHALGLFDEYERRFGREHAACEVFVRACARLDVDTTAPAPEPRASWPACPRTHPDIVESYRRVLRDKYATWGDAARWTRRNPPYWLTASGVEPEIGPR